MHVIITYLLLTYVPTNTFTAQLPFLDCIKNHCSVHLTVLTGFGKILDKPPFSPAWVNFMLNNMPDICTERKYGLIFTQKVESLAELKFDPGFWVIIEYLSQIDSILRVKLTIWHSNILQLLGIPVRILVPPVTQLFKSKWLHIFFQCLKQLIAITLVLHSCKHRDIHSKQVLVFQSSHYWQKNDGGNQEIWFGR